MEVWALEAYAASNILQEMITIKSDDVAGRTQAYEAIVKNAHIKKPNIPESFNVLIKELQAIGLDVNLLDREELDTQETLIEEKYREIVAIENKADSEEVKDTKTAKTEETTSAKAAEEDQGEEVVESENTEA